MDMEPKNNPVGRLMLCLESSLALMATDGGPLLLSLVMTRYRNPLPPSVAPSVGGVSKFWLKSISFAAVCCSGLLMFHV